MRYPMLHKVEMCSGTPSSPDTLPAYIADGLPKQDDEALRDAREYIDALLEYRSREIDEEDLPDDAEPVEDDQGRKGTLVKEMVTCGDESCSCMNGGDKHGPYFYRYYRDGGSLTSEYVGKA